MPRRVFASVIIVTLLILVCHTVIAGDVHSTGHNSVDAREIRWGGSSKYSSCRDAAIASWNALGSVNIAPDDIWHVEDLTFTDAYSPGAYEAGQYIWTPIGSDEIYINNFYLDSYLEDYRRNVFGHELGHALGIGDHDSASYRNNLLMYYVVSFISEPEPHDIDDYYALWP